MLNNSQYYQCNYRCVVCNLYFNTFEQQKQHYFTYHSRTVDQNPTYQRHIPNPYPVGNRNPGQVPYRHPQHQPYQPPHHQHYNQPPVMKKPRAQPVKCDVCGVDCSSPAAYELHISGKKHLKAVAKTSMMSGVAKTETGTSNGAVGAVAQPVKTDAAVIQQPQVLYRPIGATGSVGAGQTRCEACSVTCLQPEQLARHLEGARHKRKMKLIEFTEMKARKDPAVYCDKCDTFMTEDSMVNHLKSGKHKRKSTDKMTDEPAEKKSKNVDIPTTVEFCGFCNVKIKNAAEAITHYQTQKHSLNMVNRSKNFDLWCEVCQTSFANQQFYDSHMNGFKHFTKVNRGNTAPEGQHGGKLMKMREKMKSLKYTTKMRKTTYDKYTFIPNQPPNPVSLANAPTELTAAELTAAEMAAAEMAAAEMAAAEMTATPPPPPPPPSDPEVQPNPPSINSLM